MVSAKLFMNNRTQAVRLPKAVAFPASVREVEIRQVGEARIITPAGQGWDAWFESGARATPDFMEGRDQPLDQERTQL